MKGQPTGTPPRQEAPRRTTYRRCAALLLACSAASGGLAVAADGVQTGRGIADNGINGVAACAACHGAKGEGNPAGGFPRLAGQGAEYLAKQLDDIADGVRPSPLMAPIAKGLDPTQRKAVAAYYAGLPPPYSAAAVEASADAAVTPAQRGAWLATRGDWGKNLPACNQCHGPGGVGVGAAIPALAGQSADYLANQLKAWQAGRRSPLPLGLMPAIATRLSPQDIDAVSAYYAGLPGTSAGVTAKAGDKHE
ncbi:c-type cytochrome [Bordetella genomosp. 11]|uniref:Cytochrome C n=1 Tax=Bordetella genomosp. 11 TaxID=1416808 RepID=A0A261ULW1_9BORD|nr:c-type cytochrome [Bordetella genomosp. 11]OZI62869.1 cytochrome C [Bordetella genomosp. 11]